MLAKTLLCCVLAMLLLGVSSEAKDMTAYYKRVGAKFLSDMEKKEGVHKLPSGMLFKIEKKGPGEKSPKADSDCDVHYSGTLKDGTKFDSSYDRGSPATFKPTQVIKGWTEALQLMSEGDKWTVYIPYDIAYGASGSPPKITPYTPLVFEMELIKVKGSGKPGSEARAELEKKTGKKYDEL